MDEAYYLEELKDAELALKEARIQLDDAKVWLDSRSLVYARAIIALDEYRKSHG